MRTLPFLALLSVALTARGQDPSRASVSNALRRGVEFFRSQVAVEGTYLWQYNEDLSQREGEEKATATQAWVQPPGTPAVGLAFLEAWEATADRYYLDAAQATAKGLLRGQLQSGGWTYSIDFSPEGRRKAAYRDGGNKTARNVTTFDDDTTQAALRFLTRADAALGFHDAKIQESVEFALHSILRAQYPNGAWPQGYAEFPDPAKFPVKSASFPEDWPRVWPGSGQYWLRYTLNDQAMARTIETLFEIAKIYAQPAAGTNRTRLASQCRAAAEKAGDFLLLAQLPEPQPAWAQQYDFDMHPAWARKFEPPSVTAGESQRVLRTLLLLYRQTGQPRFLEPVPRAVDWLRRSRLSGGRLARFYELRTNRPLYFTRDYQLTYSDTNMPTHYAFKVGDDTEAIAREFEAVKTLAPHELAPPVTRPKVDPDLLEKVRSALASQDTRGRWIERGRLRTQRTDGPEVNVLRSATFIRHVELLSRYLAATRPQP